jgi:hypothetical protein
VARAEAIGVGIGGVAMTVAKFLDCRWEVEKLAREIENEVWWKAEVKVGASLERVS